MEKANKPPKQSFLDNSLINQSIEVQRDVLGGLREAKVNLPKGFKHY